MRILLATALLFVLQARGDFYSTPLGVEDMTDKQAVVQTSMGDFIIEFLPEVAPNHVGYFMKLAEEGAYDGTTFHRVILHGIIQGGDPITKDPDMRNRYGTGGLGMLRAEFNQEKHTRGAVSAVRLPGKNDSAGAQFFVCVVDQPSLDGQYTVYGRVVEGMNVVQKISEVPADPKQMATERVEIRTVTLRDKPPPEPDPPSTETDSEAPLMTVDLSKVSVERKDQ